MVYNILNGDSLAYSFPDAKIEGEIIVVREGLIDGELSGDNLHDFWQSRAKYIGLTETEYNNNVVKDSYIQRTTSRLTGQSLSKEVKIIN